VALRQGGGDVLACPGAPPSAFLDAGYLDLDRAVSKPGCFRPDPCFEQELVSAIPGRMCPALRPGLYGAVLNGLAGSCWLCRQPHQLSLTGSYLRLDTGSIQVHCRRHRLLAGQLTDILGCLGYRAELSCAGMISSSVSGRSPMLAITRSPTCRSTSPASTRRALQPRLRFAAAQQ
jgi:hypothetical protein